MWVSNYRSNSAIYPDGIQPKKPTQGTGKSLFFLNTLAVIILNNNLWYSYSSNLANMYCIYKGLCQNIFQVYKSYT